MLYRTEPVYLLNYNFTELILDSFVAVKNNKIEGM